MSTAVPLARVAAKARGNESILKAVTAHAADRESAPADEQMASGRGMGTNAIMDSGGEFTRPLGPYRFEGKPTMSQSQFFGFGGGE